MELLNGIPDSDTFHRVFEKANPQELSKILRDWLDYHCKKRNVVSIDGKTICVSEREEHKAYHAVSAFVRENRITLGEIRLSQCCWRCLI